MAEHRIETDIEVKCPASRVWALLTDFVLSSVERDRRLLSAQSFEANH